RDSAEFASTYSFDFEKRPIHISVFVPDQGTPSAFLITPEPSVTVNNPPARSGDDIGTTGQRIVPGVSTPREEAAVLWLDAAYNQILPGSWVAIEKPANADTSSGVPVESTLIISRVNEVSERSRAEYGMTAKS